MIFQWSDSNLTYDGTQLRSHFIYENWGILGPACIGFIGPCQVSLEHMVDLEDVLAKAPIASDQMLHFLWEHFDLDLAGGVLWQRLMVANLLETLNSVGVSGGIRRGNDLYWGDKKLNVSVATRSPLSTLVHLGINITSEGTPVATAALQEWGINPVEFGQKFLGQLKKEYGGFQKALWKVRAVP